MWGLRPHMTNFGLLFQILNTRLCFRRRSNIDHKTSPGNRELYRTTRYLNDIDQGMRRSNLSDYIE